MFALRILFAISFLAISVSCSSKKLESDPTESRDIYGEDAPGRRPPEDPNKLHTLLLTEEVEVTGANFFITTSPRDKALLEKTLAPAQIQKITEDTRKFFTDKGFKEVKSNRQAHVLVFIGVRRFRVLQEFDPITNEKINEIIPDGIASSKFKAQVTTRSKVIKDGVTIEDSTVVKELPIIERFYLGGNMHTYGERPKAFFSINVDIDEHNKTKLDQLEANVKEHLNKVAITAPKEPISKKDAGCYPYIGFATEAVSTEAGILAYKITEIFPKSPAEKAGLKLADRILNVDTLTYLESLNNPAVFEKLEPFTMKVSRNGDVVRKIIKPRISCDPY